jgi:AbrB family looped-hinge helix DNA binding protein
MEFARLTSKGQMTIPKRVRAAVGLETGDVLTIAVEDGLITMRKFKAAGPDTAMAGGLEEWTSGEDEDAWADL